MIRATRKTLNVAHPIVAVIDARRWRLRWSLPDLADASGESAQTIWNWLYRGVSPPIDKLERVLVATGGAINVTEAPRRRRRPQAWVTR